MTPFSRSKISVKAPLGALAVAIAAMKKISNCRASAPQRESGGGPGHLIRNPGQGASQQRQAPDACDVPGRWGDDPSRRHGAVREAQTQPCFE